MNSMSSKMGMDQITQPLLLVHSHAATGRQVSNELRAGTRPGADAVDLWSVVSSDERESRDMHSPADAGQKASLSDYLAAERTLLAWIRTGLALMGFGFVVARFGLFLQQVQIMQHTPVEQSYGLSLWFGTALIAVGVIVNVLAGWQHLRLVRELDRSAASHSHSSTQAVLVAFFWRWLDWRWQSI